MSFEFEYENFILKISEYFDLIKHITSRDINASHAFFFCSEKFRLIFLHAFLIVKTTRRFHTES